MKKISILKRKLIKAYNNKNIKEHSNCNTLWSTT